MEMNCLNFEVRGLGHSETSYGQISTLDACLTNFRNICILGTVGDRDKLIAI